MRVYDPTVIVVAFVVGLIAGVALGWLVWARRHDTPGTAVRAEIRVDDVHDK